MRESFQKNLDIYKVDYRLSGDIFYISSCAKTVPDFFFEKMICLIKQFLKPASKMSAVHFGRLSAVRGGRRKKAK